MHEPDGPKGGSLFEDDRRLSSLERGEVFFVAQSESDGLDFLGGAVVEVGDGAIKKLFLW
ncbi:MAG: hypothetical protein ACREX4_17735 [Gammaproteobacteria bacterium]